MRQFKPIIKTLSNFKPNFLWIFLLILLISIFPVPGAVRASFQVNSEENMPTLIGRLLDMQEQPVVEARVSAIVSGRAEALSETETLEDGSWRLSFSETPPEDVQIFFEHQHFEDLHIDLNTADFEQLTRGDTSNLGEQRMERRISAGFWVASVVFLVVLLLIAFERLHSTSAALAGLTAIFLISYVGGAFIPDLFIFSFERGLNYINWEVIFLVMGMMVIIAIIEETGIFQWMAFQAYRLSRGRTWLLVLILMAVTAFASALLDNFTTMLLMTPISLQIGFALGINPLALIIPEVLASNVGGITTLVGTPTNILIGAYAGIGFTDFLVNQTVGVIVALILLGGFVVFFYRDEFGRRSGGISERLYNKLKENAEIEDSQALLKSGIVFLLVLVGFVIGEQLHMDPAVSALAGATFLLVWLKPDVTHMIKAVDWTTLVFFMALFVVVGAIQEVGLISLAATGMSRLIGQNLSLGIFVIVFGVGTISMAIANIPLAASMLPIINLLSGTIPGAESKVLYYALSMGAAMGGNGFLIGAEANLVTAGITAQTNTPISFKEFAKIGVPATYLTLTVGFIWLLIHF